MQRSVIDEALGQAWPDFPVPSHHRAPFVIAARRLEMERIATPVRELFALLEAGEVFEAGGCPVMRAIDEPDGWLEVAPVLDGWIDCLVRFAPDLPCRALRQLSRFLKGGLPIAPGLVAQCRAEFEPQVVRVALGRAEDVRRATLDAQVAWEFERLGLCGLDVTNRGS